MRKVLSALAKSGGTLAKVALAVTQRRKRKRIAPRKEMDRVGATPQAVNADGGVCRGRNGGGALASGDGFELPDCQRVAWQAIAGWADQAKERMVCPLAVPLWPGIWTVSPTRLPRN